MADKITKHFKITTIIRSSTLEPTEMIHYYHILGWAEIEIINLFTLTI